MVVIAILWGKSGNTVIHVLCVVKWCRSVRRVIRIKLDQFVSENVRIIAILLRKRCQNNKHFAELAPKNGGKNSWHRYSMKKLRHWHLCILFYDSTVHR